MTIPLASTHVLGEGLRVVLTILGAGGGIFLIWLISRTVKIRNIDWSAPSTLIGIMGLAHLGLVFLNVHFFDRYLLPLMPFVLVWLAPLLRKTPTRAQLGGWILIAGFFAFSIWGTVDALNFSKAKWDISLKAQERGIPTETLVAGYEPDGFFNFTNSPDMTASYSNLPSHNKPPHRTAKTDGLGPFTTTITNGSLREPPFPLPNLLAAPSPTIS